MVGMMQVNVIRVDRLLSEGDLNPNSDNLKAIVQ